LFVSINEITVLFLALPTGNVKDSHVQHSFAHWSPPRRPYSNVKSTVLVAQFGATEVKEQGKKEKAQRVVAASSELKPGIAPPLPHNEMLARTLFSFEDQ
jgi:hypothetical protein